MSVIALSGLFDSAVEAMAARLLGSGLGRLLDGEKIADLFCGAGGWDEGAKRLGLHVDFAVNHDPVAIATHRANNPGCKHHQGDAWRAKPLDVIGHGTKLGLLLASAACTTHSRARGAAPISKRVHMLGWCIGRWMKDAQPRIVLIENVPEWKDWGPTIIDGGVRRQDPARKGQTFRKWWRYCESLGYRMEMRVLDAPDYGSASRRRRLFIIARRDGGPIVWPEPTHGEVERQVRVDSDGGKRTRSRRGNTHGGRHDRLPYRTAAECIDWSDLGTSIFDRKRPLKPKTLARICEGIRRYVLNDPQPFVLRVTQGHAPGGGWHVYPASGTAPTQTTRQDVAVCVPVVAPQNTGVYGQRVDATGPTITTKGHQSLITPILATTGYGERAGQAARVHQVAELLGTCVDGVKQGIASPVLQVIRGDVAGRDVRDPLPTVTAGNGPGRGAGAGHAMGIATPVLMNNTTHHTGGRVDGPTPTVTTGGQCGVAAPVMAYLNQGGKQVGGVDEPLRTVVSGGGHAMLVAALMAEYYGHGSGKTGRRADEPLGAITTLDRHGLVVCVIDGVEFVIVDILFRMLRPAELAQAMGFPPTYLWPKTQRDTVRLIGNAVEIYTAEALIGAVLPEQAAEWKAGAA